jgi:hypothetical protein
MQCRVITVLITLLYTLCTTIQIIRFIQPTHSRLKLNLLLKSRVQTTINFRRPPALRLFLTLKIPCPTYPSENILGPKITELVTSRPPQPLTFPTIDTPHPTEINIPILILILILILHLSTIFLPIRNETTLALHHNFLKLIIQPVRLEHWTLL